jgi:hypothetical protein
MTRHPSAIIMLKSFIDALKLLISYPASILLEKSNNARSLATARVKPPKRVGISHAHRCSRDQSDSILPSSAHRRRVFG